MSPNQFAQKICKGEGKLKQVNIAQVSEILKVANKLTGGLLYGIIKIIPA